MGCLLQYLPRVSAADPAAIGRGVLLRVVTCQLMNERIPLTGLCQWCSACRQEDRLLCEQRLGGVPRPVLPIRRVRVRHEEIFQRDAVSVPIAHAEAGHHQQALEAVVHRRVDARGAQRVRGRRGPRHAFPQACRADRGS
eukprot:5869447-Pyramimonas_sp.AAC.2